MKFARKKLSVLLAVIMCLTLVTSASADLLYGAMSGGFTTDQIGMIVGDNAPTKGLVTNLGGTMGARISAFRTENGGSRAAFCAYANANNPNGGDNVLIWDPYNTDWKKPLKELPMDKNPVSNVRGMAFSGKYLYACGYDFATVARFDMTNDAYTNDKTFNGHNDGKHHAEAIVTYNNFVYVLVTYAANPWSGDGGYEKNKLLQFTPDLQLIKCIELNGKNTDGGTVGAVCLKGGKLYVTSIGGSQSYSGVPNPASNIDVVDLDTMKVKELISVETLKAQYGDDEDMFGKWTKKAYPCDFKGITVTPDGTVYIVANGWNPNTTAVFKTTEKDLENAKTNAKTTWKMIKVFYFGAYVFPGSLYDAASGNYYVSGAEKGEYTGSLYKTSDGGITWTKYNSKALGGAFSAVAFDALLKALVPPQITTSGLADGAKGKPYSAVLTAEGSQPVTWSGTSLPAGLELNESGSITGTPAKAGSFEVTVTAKNAAGTSSKKLSLKITTDVAAPKITAATLDNGTVGVKYNDAIEATGTNPTWILTGGALPDGLELSPAGVIAGVPTKTGKFAFTVKAENEEGSDSAELTIAVGMGEAPQPVKPDIQDKENVPANVDTTQRPTVYDNREAAVSAMSSDITANDLEITSDGSVIIKESKAKEIITAALGGEPLAAVHTLPVFKITTTKEIAASAFKVRGDKLLASTFDKVDIRKIVSSTETLPFKYVADAKDYADGTFTVLNLDGSNAAGAINTEATYQVLLFIKDDGNYDLDKTAGSIVDPAAIIKTNTSTDAPSSGSSSGGCSAGVGAFALFALIPLFLRRKR